MSLVKLNIARGVTGTLPTSNYVQGGIQVADQWRLSADSVGDKSPITVWEKIDSTYNGTIGTGMSLSTGVFTFPQTGIWKVDFVGNITRAQSDDQMHFTLTNESSNTLVFIIGGVAGANYNSVVSFSVLLDITDVSNNNNKIKLVQSNSGTADGAASAKIHGDSTRNESGLTFTRLGDT